MPPSMDGSKKYFTRLAIGLDTVFAADCTCDCSGKVNNKKDHEVVDDRVLCVYNLPLILQICRSFSAGFGIYLLYGLAPR